MLDVRRDSLGAFYELNSSGDLSVRSGTGEDRAIWNIILLKLDLEFLVSYRKGLLEKLELSERLLTQLDRHIDKASQIESVLNVLVPDIEEHFLLLHALDISVSPALWSRLRNMVPQSLSS